MIFDAKLLETFYSKQVETLKKTSPAFGNLAFVPKDFVCWGCKNNILSNDKILKNAINGVLITGCPFCSKSFCD